LPAFPATATQGWSDAVQLRDPCYPDASICSYMTSIQHRNTFNSTWIRNQFTQYSTPCVLESMSFSHWHWAGEVFASLSCAQKNVIQSLRFLDEVSSVASRATSGKVMPETGSGAIGLTHGFIWYIVGKGNHTWSFLLNFCAGTFYLNCAHGIGHGFVYRHILDPFGSTRLKLDIMAVRHAIVMCKLAPSRGYMYMCSHGAYHLLMETSDIMNVSSWHSPCLTADLPASCFYYLFHDGLMVPWRLQGIQHADSFRDICSSRSSIAHQFKTEAHIRSCINGLSARGYFTFFRTVHRHKRFKRIGIDSSPEQTCFAQATDSFVAGHLSGRTLESETWFCSSMLSRPSLLPTLQSASVSDWCSFLLPNLDFTIRRGKMRWLACVSGIFGVHHFGHTPPPCDSIGRFPWSTSEEGWIAAWTFCREVAGWWSNEWKYYQILDPEERLLNYTQ